MRGLIQTVLSCDYVKKLIPTIVFIHSKVNLLFQRKGFK